MISRQRKWQLNNVLAGVCERCGNEELHTKKLCKVCSTKANVKRLELYYRKKEQKPND